MEYNVTFALLTELLCIHICLQ